MWLEARFFTHCSAQKGWSLTNVPCLHLTRLFRSFGKNRRRSFGTEALLALAAAVFNLQLGALETLSGSFGSFGASGTET